MFKGIGLFTGSESSLNLLNLYKPHKHFHKPHKYFHKPHKQKKGANFFAPFFCLNSIYFKSITDDPNKYPSVNNSIVYLPLVNLFVGFHTVAGTCLLSFS